MTKIGTYELMLGNGVSFSLFNVCYSPYMTRNILSFHALYLDGFKFEFDNDNGSILVYKHSCLYFTTYPCNGV